MTIAFLAEARAEFLEAVSYYIPYIVRGSTLWLLAVAHGSRQPEYWIERKKKIG